MPPWQLVEQHSVPEAHAFPSVVQLDTVGLTGWQTLPEQTPEQQSDALLHPAPTVAHEVPHSPAVHVREQHCDPSVHAAPGPPQNADDVHSPLAQWVEQQSAPVAQVSPPTLHADTAAPHEPALHTPEQQSQGLAQPPLPAQVVGFTQYPPAQSLEQQFESDEQALPTALHCDRATHVPPAQAYPEQQPCELHAEPGGRHWFAGPHTPPLHPAAEQHSTLDEQMAPSALQTWTVWHVPLGHAPEQHSDPKVQVAPFDLHAAADARVLLWQATCESAARRTARPASEVREDGAMRRIVRRGRESLQRRQTFEASVRHAQCVTSAIGR